MTKEQTNEVKTFVDNITGRHYTKTYSSKSKTLHIRIGTYIDGAKERDKEWITDKEKEREEIIEKLQKNFKQYKIEKNNKRYQGFINDICITVQ